MTDPAGVIPETICDVVVVGGGPAGSTIAALLAVRGFHTVLVEKDKHPRFHIGESLLPLNLPLLRQLGVLDQVERIGMLKLGAEFISPHHEKPVSYYFSRVRNSTTTYAYQVRRSEFDLILLKNASDNGAAVTENCRVTGVNFLSQGGARVIGQLTNGEQLRWRARFLVDASGRDTLLASQLGIKRRNPRHNSAALYGHFIGARRMPGKAEGNISIIWFPHGWFWFIPLADGTTSVGAVCWPGYIKSRTSDLDSFFIRTIGLCPELADRLSNAQLIGHVTGTGNYSYQAGRMTGPSHIILGDAFAFIDPVFSTGVYLAMNGAFMGAVAVTRCLQDPSHAPQALREFELQVRRGLKTFSWYIYRVTMPAFCDLFMSPNNVLRIEEAVVSLLAGDVYRRSPLRLRLFLFKLLYYLIGLKAPIASYQRWRKHQRDIRTLTDRGFQDDMAAPLL